MFSEVFEDRLRSWRQFRERLNVADNPFDEVIMYYSKAPRIHNKGIDMWNSLVDIINSSITSHQVSLALSIGILGGLWPIPMTSFIGCIILQTILGACFKIDARQMMLIQIVVV